jgi:hypothetical protein
MNTEQRVIELEKRVTELEKRISESRTNSSATALIETNSQILKLELDKLAAKLDFVDRPQFFIGASSITSTDISGLFESESAAAVKIFEHPYQIRPNGFAPFISQQRSTIVDGMARELLFSSQGRRIIRTGEFSVLFRGDDDFLGWAMRGGGWPIPEKQLESPWQINSLVLIEATYCSVVLAKQLLQQGKPKPNMIQYVIGYKNLLWNGRGPKLLDGKADQQLQLRQRVPTDVGDCFFSVVADDEEPEARTAFRLVAEIYHLFHLVDDRIPYSKVDDSRRIIDIAQI